MTPIIETQKLSKRYRKTSALADVSLIIPAGAIYALVGANGAGKTTLIKLLMNILRPSAGRASVLGTASTKVAGKVFQRIAYVSENQELPEGMTVKAFLGYLRSFYPQWDKPLEAQLIRQFDLPLDRKLKNLSRGMKMKAALVGVLAYHPSLIVLDEPFSGLDPLVRAEFIESLLERRAETTILLSSHDLMEIESFASHVGYLENGRLLFSEEMSTLANRFREVAVTMASPANDFGKSRGIPLDAPATWLQPRMEGAVFRFVDSNFTETTDVELARRFPEATDIAVTPMALRKIFLAIARSGRSTGSRASETGAV